MRRKAEIQEAFSPTSALDDADGFFMVGIGGAGMSALARMLAHRGFEVAGSDAIGSPEIERLRSEGIEIVIGHSADAAAELKARAGEIALIVTDAVDLEGSPEVRWARENQAPIARRSQALGWALREYRVIAVTGTHGKTTTTGLIGAGLIAAGLDPLVVVGAAIPEWGGPVREGEGDYAVVEACEAYDAFHDLDPYIVVLTNLEPDHLDFHGTYENLRDSVVRFVDRVPEGGALVYCADDRGASEVAELTGVMSLPYGVSRAWLQQVSNKFDLGLDAAEMLADDVALALPGVHNRLNAAGALAAAAVLNESGTRVDLSVVQRGVAAFRGAERRLQVAYDEELTVVDDYAHHPSEIAASLSALRERYAGRRLVVVYQPHMYSRTRDHLVEFAEALSAADLVVLTDIYPAREDPIPGVSSARIAELLRSPGRYVSSRHLLPREVATLARPGDVIVAMGAGNISDFSPAFVHELSRRREGKRRRVAVVAGGDSSEREVSLLSGRAVVAALQQAGHAATFVDVSEWLLRDGRVHSLVGGDRPDVAFLAVHGTNAEDGAVQGFFELLHLPYTGSGVLASALAMDKRRAKEVLARAGIRVPRGVEVSSSSDPISLPLPLVVKPNAEGSTVGLTFVKDFDDLPAAIERALEYGSRVLVEERIVGVEISVPVIPGPDGQPIALPPVEIAPAGGVYDFERKYTPGATNEIIPARIAPERIEEARAIAVAAHVALGCAGATRTDMILDREGFATLEVNTLPGLTATSLLPASAAAAGIAFPSLCELLVEDAIRTAEHRRGQDGRAPGS